MSDAHAVSVSIVAYLALFSGVGLFFIFIHLFLGKFVRANNPHPEKLEIYECGEPTIGSSFTQFDLRFYTVALLFIIFDVEVAFFFPWAAVFGKANHMTDKSFALVEKVDGQIKLKPSAAQLYQEMGVRHPTAPTVVPPSLEKQVLSGDPLETSEAVIRQGSRQFALISLLDIAFFFGILMVGFLYVWKRGDLDWVRALSHEQARPGTAGGGVTESEPALSV